MPTSSFAFSLQTSPEAAENFDARFTTMPIIESPVTPSPLSSSYSALFQGFSYVAPALLEGQGMLGR
ncbi:hypothetical protein BC937DRAFT_94440 [Endogone sp. FLAS-F59071]|nr:hypothetical protein BC937DRAFT_94440 [Endogone sp. FLAS-F59071]|eukprot:RUS14035.1 hypothetical protein BC937DRAFT_94440 [Endogone sp. FLAS-F59071]